MIFINSTYKQEISCISLSLLTWQRKENRKNKKKDPNLKNKSVQPICFMTLFIFHFRHLYFIFLNLNLKQQWNVKDKFLKILTNFILHE